MYLSTSPQDYQGAGGRTRIVSEIRYGVADAYRVVLLCFVPIRRYARPRALQAARAALAAETGIAVRYVPRLPRGKNGVLRIA